MDRTDLLDLCERVQRVQDETEKAQRQLAATIAESIELVTAARHVCGFEWNPKPHDGLTQPLPLANTELAQAALEAARQIRSILERFPLHWQVAIVKALGAQTAVLAEERRRAKPVLSA